MTELFQKQYSKRLTGSKDEPELITEAQVRKELGDWVIDIDRAIKCLDTGGKQQSDVATYWLKK